MMLDIWAQRWAIPANALKELRQLMGVDPVSYQTPLIKQSEAAILNAVRAEASRKGARLWRNNVGATYTEDGAFIRYGLCNDSAKLNKIIKSSDLIGIKPVIITQDMLGRTIGQFLSRETKTSDWKFTNTEREQAQLKWIELINSLGGDACFTTNINSI